MASRLVGYWRRISMSTPGATKAYAAAGSSTASKHWLSKPEFAPVVVSLGLILLSMSFGLYTTVHQLAYNPSVRVSKKKRETLPEVTDPDSVADEADKFVRRSFFRKLAHVQDINEIRAGTVDPMRPNPFHMQRRVETLRSVGVEP